MSQRISRRRAIRSLGAGVAITILPNAASVCTAQANEKVNIAHVGCGGRGQELIDYFSKLGNIVAMCDVNQSKAGPKYALFPDVPKFEDFRVMLDTMGAKIDAVVIAVPDHNHAVIAAAAIRAGKHVHVEKPLSRTVRESRVLRALAAEHKVATSMGNQGTAAGPYRRALELIQQGAIGAIREVHIWNESGGADHQQAPKDSREIPPYINWDLWLGAAKMRPFSPTWMRWGQWRDFGTGALGNWASHTANLPFRALKVNSLWSGKEGAAIEVEAKVPGINRISFPKWEVVTWKIPARGDLPPITFNWYNGRGPGTVARLEQLLGRDLDWGDKGPKKWTDFAGTLIIGGNGAIHSTGHNATFKVLPEEQFKDVQTNRPEREPASRGHERDFLDACRGGKPAWAAFDYAAPLNEFLQIANIATQFDGPLKYDPVGGKITNNAEADALITPEFREGWKL